MTDQIGRLSPGAVEMDRIADYLSRVRQAEDFISPAVLDPIPYNNPGKNTWVEISNPEFTSLCPKTGLPDFGTIHIKYLPDHYIVELKSLKYYFLQFRDTGIFYENLTRLILDHLVGKLAPFELIVEAIFTSRGGLSSKVTSHYRKD